MQQLAAKLENDARNELHSVLGMLELIARGPLDDAQSDYLHACKASADRLLRSLQNVTEFLCPDTEGPRSCIFDVHELVANVGGLLELLAGRKGLRLSIELQAGVPARVTGDPDRLQDILVRLLDNAVRFTEQGQIQLVVTETQTPSSGRQLQFAISDTGPGIPTSVIDRLSMTASEQAEHGLGLPIVRKLALSMSGNLTIGSRDGGGSVVTVSVPFQAAPASAVSVQTATSGTALALNILVVEDSDDSYYVLEAYLRQYNHRLTRAANGARAVDLFKAGRYDLVFMDIHMPDMDGYTATRAIRTWETGRLRARVPIVVLSSDSPATQFAHGAQAGCSGYLTKPVSLTALSKTLARYAAAIA